MEDDGGVNLRVAVRVRPLSKAEKAKRVTKVVSTSQGRCVSVASRVERTFQYEAAFGPFTPQRQVYETMVAPVIDEVLSGFNCTVFAYGQTGTGKTWTMEGSLDDDDDAGIMPRCARSIFASVDEDFSVRVSAVEVYNEELSDLLDTGKKSLKIIDGPGGVRCAGNEEVSCKTVDECLAALKRASKARRVSATMCNERSSRSHAIFTVRVCVRSLADDGRDLVVNGQLNLVDLAGSECVGKSGATKQGQREAGSINQSLLTLGRVITALTGSRNSNYVPYRDSKLTRLLQDSLGGRAKTTLIATVSPGQNAVDETLSTLQYALRAKSIRNQPEQHARYHGKAVVKAISHEVDELRLLLRQQRDKNGGVLVDNETWDATQQELAALRMEIVELHEAYTAVKDERDTARSDVREFATALEQENAAHAATQAVAEALSDSERSLLKGGKQCVKAFRDCQQQLGVLVTEAQGLLRDRDLASKGALRVDAAVDSTRSLLETDALYSATSDFSSALQDGLQAVVRTVDAAVDRYTESLKRAQTFASRVVEDADQDAKRVRSQDAALINKVTERAAASTIVTADLCDDHAHSVASLRSATAEGRRVMNEVLPAAVSTTDLEASLSRRFEEHTLTVDAAIRSDEASVESRTRAFDQAAELFDSFKHHEEKWLATMSTKLRQVVEDAIETARDERLRSLDAWTAARVASSAAATRNLEAEDASRLGRLWALKSEDPALYGLAQDKLRHCASAARSAAARAADALPTEDAYADLSDRVAQNIDAVRTAAATSAAQTLSDSRELVALLGAAADARRDDCRTRARAFHDGIDAPALAQRLKEPVANVHQTLAQQQQILAAAVDENVDATRGTLAELKNVASAHVGQTVRPASTTSVDMGGHQRAVDAASRDLDVEPVHHDAVVARFYADLAAKRGSTASRSPSLVMAKHRKKHASLPLRESSNFGADD